MTKVYLNAKGPTAKYTIVEKGITSRAPIMKFVWPLLIAIAICSSCTSKQNGLIAAINDTKLTPEAKVQHMEDAVDMGVNVNSNTRQGDTPLICAVSKDDLVAVDFLLERGANANAINIRGESPISLAVEKRNWNLVQLLKDNGANIDTRNNNGETLLFIEAKNGDRDSVQRLIQMGASINARGRPTLIGAAASGDLPLVKMLVENHHADVNTVVGKSLTPLSAAAGKGHVDILKYLIDSGANINSGEGTPLWISVGTGHFECVKFLVEKGADMNEIGNSGRPPILQAALHGYEDIVAYLFISGARYPEFDPENDLYATALINRVFADFMLNKSNKKEALKHYIAAHDYYRKSSEHFGDMAKQIQQAKTKEAIKRFLLEVIYLTAVSVNAQNQSQLHAQQFAEVSAMRIATESGTGLSGYSKAYNSYYTSYLKTSPETSKLLMIGKPFLSNSQSILSPDDQIKYFNGLAGKAQLSSDACGAIANCITNKKDEEEIEQCIIQKAKRNS